MRIAALIAATLLTVPARADDPALAAKLYGALQLMSGSAGTPQVTAERDGDTVTLTIQSDQIEVGEPPQRLPFTWTLRANRDGTYAITGFAVPSPVIVKKDGVDPETRAPQTITGSFLIPPITATGNLDPALKSTQLYDLRVKNITGAVDIARETGGTHVPGSIATLATAVEMGPVVDGLTDIVRTGAIGGLRAEFGTPQGPAVVTVGALTARFVARGANPAATLAAATALQAQMEAAKKPDGTLDLARGASGLLKPLLAVLGSSGRETDNRIGYTDVAADAGDTHFALHGLGVHLGSDSAATTHAFMELTAEGLTAPVPDAFASLVPKNILFRPAVRGVDAKRFARLVDLASAEPRDTDAIQAAALDITASPGAAFDIEALHLDLAETVLDAHGTVHRVAAGPVPAQADMEVRATGFDALIRKLGAIPEAQQVLPALIYAKGLGKQEGGTTIWIIHTEGAQVLVNGVPAMPASPGAAPAPTPAPGGKPRKPLPRN